MYLSLQVSKQEDGSFTATIAGVGDEGTTLSARSDGNIEAHVAVSRAARLFSRLSPEFGTNLESPTKKNLESRRSSFLANQTILDTKENSQSSDCTSQDQDQDTASS